MPALQYSSKAVESDFQEFLTSSPSGAYEGRWGRGTQSVLLVSAALLGFCPSNAGGQVARSVSAQPSGWGQLEAPLASPLPVHRDQVPIAASEALAGVRSNLSLNVSELATILGVGRPTIYSWMTDEAHPRAANAERLSRLAALARLWETLSNLPLGGRVRQPTAVGDTFVSFVAAERYVEAEELLRAAAKLPEPGGRRRIESVRDALRRTGLADRVGSKQDEIDRIAR